MTKADKACHLLEGRGWVVGVERVAEPFGLEVWQLLAPQLPDSTTLSRTVAESRIHNWRHR